MGYSSFGDMARAGLQLPVAAAIVGGVTYWLLYHQRRKSSSRGKWRGWGIRSYQCPPHVSAESKRRAEMTQLRPTDVVVITFPKTGTTWLQQVCEQLRTGGNMEFSEITERQPWLEFSWDCGQDLEADQVAFPRLFKSHQALSAINTGAKYLSILRDPKATLLSFYNFMKEKDRPPFSECANVNDYVRTGHFGKDSFFAFGINIWDFYVELWEARHEPNVLILCYEVMIKDTMSFLPLVADFLGAPADAARLEVVERMASKTFMASCAHQFDDHFIREKQEEFGRAVMWIVPGVKVVGESQAKKEVLSEQSLQWLEEQWKERVTPRIGFATYFEMTAALTAELRVTMSQ